MRRLLPLLFPILLLAACSEDGTSPPLATCDPRVDSVEIDGETLRISGQRLVSTTGLRGVQVYFDDLQATVVETWRDGCETCSACESEADFNCTSCDEVCDGEVDYVHSDGLFPASVCDMGLVVEIPDSVGDSAELTVFGPWGSAQLSWSRI